CLDCGKWAWTNDRNRIDDAQLALVKYKLGAPPKRMIWGPFPFRLDSGAIVFPSTCGGGWIWKNEYLEGEKLFPHVEFHGAYIYRTQCNHQPFKEIAPYYVYRLKIGKEGPGIVVKL